MRKILIGAGVLVGVFVLFAVGVGLFFDVNHYKPRIEQALNQATGLTLKINGKASLRIFPRIHIALNDVHLSNPSQPGKEVFSANEIQVAPRAMPFLLHRQVIVDQVSLVKPLLHIEKSTTGRMNFEASRAGQKAAPSSRSSNAAAPEEIHSIVLKDGTLQYVDHVSGDNVAIDDLNVDLSSVAWSQVNLMKSLSFHGKVDMGSVKAQSLTATDVKAQIRDDRGLIHLDPIQANLFGGSIHGTADADLRGSSPKIALSQTLSGIDLDQAAPSLKNRVSGKADGTVKVSATGRDAASLTKTLNGTVAIQGQGIKTAIDVDKVATNLKSPQVADLANLGSSLFSAPAPQRAGQAAGTAGSTLQQFDIHNLISNWKITQGVAQTQKVALSTAKNTIALKGDVNLNSKQYQDFYVGTVDDKGCAQKKVKISGPLNHPSPELGNYAEETAKGYLASPKSFLGSEGSQIAGALGGLEGKAPSKSGEKPNTEKSCDQFYRA